MFSRRRIRDNKNDSPHQVKELCQHCSQTEDEQILRNRRKRNSVKYISKTVSSKNSRSMVLFSSEDSPRKQQASSTTQNRISPITQRGIHQTNTPHPQYERTDIDRHAQDIQWCRQPHREDVPTMFEDRGAAIEGVTEGVEEEPVFREREVDYFFS